MWKSLLVILVLLGSGLLVSACKEKSESPAAVQARAVNVTTAVARRMDLPVTEAAVGSETAVADSIAAGARPRLRMPFPLEVARRMKIGQAVTLRNFGEGGTATGRIQAIRPALNATTASAEVIVQVTGPAGWQPRGSVRGEVVLEVHNQAVVVPETAVVLRPAGSVVYVAEDGVAHERKVTTGVTRNGLTEITEGLDGGEAVVKDGAPMLSEGAKLREPEANP
jgi:hypothetical protein